MVNSTKNTIREFIENNEKTTVKQLMGVFLIKRQMVQRHLVNLINEGSIIKTGIPPKVFYSIRKSSLQDTGNANEYSGENIIISHDDLFKNNIDIGGRDLVIGFNEPAFKKSIEKIQTGDLDSPLNARLITYFLPAVQIAKKQKTKPRLIIITGVNAALKYNTQNNEQKKIIYRNNMIKLKFIEDTLNKFFPDVFSLIEARLAYDFMKIPENKLDKLWEIFEKRYPEKVKYLTEKLTNFSSGGKTITSKEKLTNAFRYSVLHLFSLGDINLDYDFIHNPNGYCSIGEHQELVFNTIRNGIYNIIKDIGDIVFEREVHCFDNLKIIIKDENSVPPPYNGAFRKSGDKISLDEVTYENNRELSYYETRPRLKESVDYLYKIIKKEDYEKYWNEYKKNYFDLKEKYNLAYKIEK